MALEGNSGNNRELYEDFRRKLLAGGESDIFYDEDDLVEIYDQASDMEDEYVKLQVILLAYRLYPGSDAIAARRGYFFWSYNMDEGVARLLDEHSGSDKLIWKILALRAGKLSAEDITARLEELLKEQTDIDDETMIQLVDLASEAGAFDWLKNNENLLRGKTSYLPTLLYELQIVGLIHGDRDYAISKLEELTEIEPFVVDYWNILSEEQMNAGNIEAAINAADYALAIDAENQEAILARCRAMACSEESDPAETLRLIQPILTKELTDSRALKIAVAAMLQLNRTEEAMQALTEFSARCPWDRGVIDYLLVLRYPDINSVLHSHYAALATDNDNQEEYWIKWATEKYSEGKYKEAAMILGCYATNEPLSKKYQGMYATALYLTGFYIACAALLLNQIEEEPDNLNHETVITGLISMIRLEHNDEAKQTLKQIQKIRMKNYDNEKSDPLEILRNSGYYRILDSIETYLSKKRTTSIDPLDPYFGIRDPEIDY